jgi:hypothetical protein
MKQVSFYKRGMMLITAVTLIGLFFFMSSCGSGTQDQPKTDSATVSAPDSSKVAVRKFDYPIPTPFEITTMLNKAGASYILDLSNSVDNADKYITEVSKALNLGVYGADLSYASTYNKTENTRLYLSKVQKLTEELGISSAVNQTIIERVEKNISNTDTIYSIISSSYYDTFDYLNQQDKGAVSVLVLTGGFVESLYISTQLFSSAQKKDELLKGISNQKATFDELLVLIRAYKDKHTGVAEIFDELSKFKEVFDNLKEGEVLNKNQEKVLNQKVEALRTKITKM